MIISIGGIIALLSKLHIYPTLYCIAYLSNILHITAGENNCFEKFWFVLKYFVFLHCNNDQT
nr:MAG TPA: hypothetical protein [Caudoviricetes sp.]